MDDENQNPVIEELLSRRRALLDLREKAERNQLGNVDKTSVSQASVLLPEPSIDETNEYEDFDSDDSVNDKTYKPTEDADSSASYISDSMDSVVISSNNYRIGAVKRQLFLPENSPQSDFDDFITPEELFGPQPLLQSNLVDDLNETDLTDKCSSPKRKKFLFQVKEQISMETNLDFITVEEDRDCRNSILTNSRELILQHSPNVSALVHLGIENDKHLNMTQKKFNFDVRNDIFSYGIMIVDCNGVIHLPNNNQGASKEDTPIKPKKKEKNPLKWKRAVAKLARLKGSPYRSCEAKNKLEVDGRQIQPPCSCRAKCYERISEEERRIIFNQFWKQCSNWEQRRQLITKCVIKTKKRLMKSDGNFDTDKRKFSFTYSLHIGSKSVKVCRVMFLNTFWIGEKFVKLSLTKQLDCGITETDKRGKHVPSNKTPEPIVQSVIDHINSYPCYESHYSRQKTTRKFLGPELNISKMYEQYLTKMKEKSIPPELIAKQSLI